MSNFFLMEEGFLELEILENRREMLYDSYCLYSEAGDEEKSETAGKGLASVIKGIFNKISKLFQDVIEMMRNALSKKEHITSKDYVNSDLGKEALDVETKRYAEELKDRINEGSKLSQKIESGLGLDEDTVHNYVEKVSASCNKKLNKKALVGIGAAGISTLLAIAMAGKRSMDKSYNCFIKNTNGEYVSDKKAKKVVKQTLKNASDDDAYEFRQTVDERTKGAFKKGASDLAKFKLVSSLQAKASTILMDLCKTALGK